MLTTLSVKNLALIENIEIDLYDGFSIFSGETGAGKSILMGAIGLLLGNRAASEHIRSGEEQAEVSGHFSFEKVPTRVTEICNENEIEILDKELIIRRIISKNGRNRILINQVATPLSTLKTVGNELIDLHGQHDHQTLLHEEAAINIIDSLPKVKPVKELYLKSYKDYLTAEKILKDHRKRAIELAEKKEFLQFQFDELASLELKTGEESELEEEYRLLSSITERAQSASAAINLIDGDMNSSSVSHIITQISSYLVELSKNDNQFIEWKDELKGAASLIDDLGSTLASYIRDIENKASPQRLDQINNRLSKIQRLEKKYLCDYESLVIKQSELTEELDAIFNIDADESYLSQKLSKSLVTLNEKGKQLTNIRESVSSKFCSNITTEMALLGFNGGAFAVQYIDTEKPTENGISLPVFVVKANKGEPFYRLDRTASGGEISRIMLAIKTVLADSDPVPILVFDEIDTGVGGKIASDIAIAIEKLAKHHQIFVISHLHQIAAKATHHYSVYKKEKNGRTVTEINRLDENSRVLEIARMLGGEGDAEINHAKQLLQLKGTE